MSHPFIVGGTYRNRHGEYKVLGIYDGWMTIRYVNGDERKVGIARQAQFWENARTEEEPYPLRLISKAREHAFSVACALALILCIIIILGYIYAWDWAGMVVYEYGPGSTPIRVDSIRTFWDWLDLLFVPLVIALGAWWLNRTQKDIEFKIAEGQRREDREIAERRDKTERKIAADRKGQETLETYYDRMADLLLTRKLRETKEQDEERSIARARTLAVLRSLDGKRKGQVLQFLSESELIIGENVIVNLKGADLSGAALNGTNLERANLGKANLGKANLSESVLSKAILSEADLREADLSEADLSEAKVISKK